MARKSLSALISRSTLVRKLSNCLGKVKITRKHFAVCHGNYRWVIRKEATGGEKGLVLKRRPRLKGG